MTAQSQSETPLFVKLYDLLAWLTPCVEKFPKSQRFLLASRLLDAGYACYGNLVRARKVTGADRAQALLAADVDLELLRVHWRLAHELRCISTDQYRHGARLIDEVGRSADLGSGWSGGPSADFGSGWSGCWSADLGSGWSGCWSADF